MRILGSDWDVVTVATSAPAFTLGTIAMDHSANKIYKYIKFNEGAGAIAGVADRVCYYHPPGATPDDSYAEHTVTMDLSDSDEIGAGVLQAAMSNGDYGWIQIKGPATLGLSLTAGADGDPLTPTGSTDGTLDVSALHTDHKCAWAIDVSANSIMCDFPF